MAKRFLGKYDAQKGRWLKDFKHFVLLLIAVFLLFRFVIGVSRVEGESMSPNYPSGSVVVYLRTARHFSAGDVVAVRMAYGEFYIKRVVALGGDEVEVKDGSLYVNGQSEQEPWVNGATEEEGGLVEYPCRIPEGRYFVLGDNRGVSIDSRSFGPISQSQILGKVFFHF